MGRLKLTLLLLVALGTTGGPLCAQQGNQDVVVLADTKGTQRVTGTVLKETWQTVEVDRAGSGKADVAYETDQVRRIEYANQPRYMIDARLLKRNPKELIDKLSRAYVDDSTPNYVLQHAYYQIAATYAELAKTDAAMLPKAVEAYDKLFSKIPDTRYAVTGRIELGNLLLDKGQGDQAIKQFKILADGGYGPKVARQGKLMVARMQMSLKQFDQAEKLLSDLATGGVGESAEFAQEVKLLRSRSLVGHKKFEEAYRDIQAVLADKPTERMLGMAYGVLGDLFAAKGLYKTALTAYLKVPMMYGAADDTEKVLAVEQACLMLEKLGRAEEARTLKKQLGE